MVEDSRVDYFCSSSSKDQFRSRYHLIVYPKSMFFDPISWFNPDTNEYVRVIPTNMPLKIELVKFSFGSAYGRACGICLESHFSLSVLHSHTHMN